MTRFVHFALGLLLLVHYVVLGVGGVGRRYAYAGIAFFTDSLGFSQDWAVRFIYGGPAVFAGAVLLFCAVRPRRKT